MMSYSMAGNEEKKDHRGIQTERGSMTSGESGRDLFLSTLVEVIEKEHLETLPITEAKCPRCGHTKAYYWTVQTRAADEAATKFFKCQKCEHTWREYD